MAKQHKACRPTSFSSTMLLLLVNTKHPLPVQRSKAAFTYTTAQQPRPSREEGSAGCHRHGFIHSCDVDAVKAEPLQHSHPLRLDREPEVPRRECCRISRDYRLASDSAANPSSSAWMQRQLRLRNRERNRNPPRKPMTSGYGKQYLSLATAHDRAWHK